MFSSCWTQRERERLSKASWHIRSITDRFPFKPIQILHPAKFGPMELLSVVGFPFIRSANFNQIYRKLFLHFHSLWSWHTAPNPVDPLDSWPSWERRFTAQKNELVSALRWRIREWKHCLCTTMSCYLWAEIYTNTDRHFSLALKGKRLAKDWEQNTNWALWLYNNKSYRPF